MSKNIDIELIIAYINDEITDSYKREEIRNNIENNPDWFATYLNLKSSSLEIENIELEVTPDQLLNPSANPSSVKKSESSLFGFSWLLKPQIAMGAACMLIIAVFLYISPQEEDDLNFPSPVNNIAPATFDSIIYFYVDGSILTIDNRSTGKLTASVNGVKSHISAFDYIEIELENGKNKVVVVNSEMDTVKDTTITINE